MSKFEGLTRYEKELIYLGLKKLIESGEGEGFHNSDMGHPVYRTGTKGKLESLKYADGPEKNKFFQLLSKLCAELKDEDNDVIGYINWYDFSTWQSFCKFATDVYKKKHNLNEG